MARVAVLLKVMPNSLDIKLNDLKNEIMKSLPEGYKIIDSKEEPVAFGLKALILLVSMPENTEGGTEEIESLIRNVDGVEDVEVETVSRLSE
ncbi:translation elongation factor aEF-1 beta [Caldisphaera lagunensis DSM 15908]|uniref:Elongation factor 1-beta n=1 Tax=Caldisphaera lagunensis (strain DSM 15908 / JCM 11604 / ANMR 0165 / IC-154) TaxID=1056495 RepID=L0ADF9_CALLD|nr:elongation factor 1-beta [Caldisphaera lagunensis]AFZ71152.1 translation elongation factor aEF-1 beta [Caldisphaera lagunensis DSM 15908]